MNKINPAILEKAITGHNRLLTNKRAKRFNIF